MYILLYLYTMYSILLKLAAIRFLTAMAVCVFTNKYQSIIILPSGITQSESPSSTRISRRQFYTNTSSRSASTDITGWPSAPTVGRQWQRKVRKYPPPPPPPREEYQQLTNVPTIAGFKQDIMNHVLGVSLCWLKVIALSDTVGMGARQVASRTLDSYGFKK